jgi:hypothetical protein
MVRFCQRLVASSRFVAFFLVVIVLNALVLGAQTYDSVEDE